MHINISLTIGKHAYSNILKISPPKSESFQIKIMIFFIFLLIFHVHGAMELHAPWMADHRRRSRLDLTSLRWQLPFAT